MVEGGYEKGIKRKMDTDETDSKKKHSNRSPATAPESLLAVLTPNR